MTRDPADYLDGITGERLHWWWSYQPRHAPNSGPEPGDLLAWMYPQERPQSC